LGQAEATHAERERAESSYGGSAVTDVMRALIIDGPGSARVNKVEVPVPAAGQVVVDVHRVGICGTDIELFTGELAYFTQGKSRFPLRPGHEWCGVVSAVGAGVDEAWYGARVTGDTMLGCGRCHRCRAGNGHVCADRHEIGITDWPGALADKVLVPTTSLHRLPATVDDRAAALVEPGGNAQRAVAAAHAGPGKRILVWGPGTIGLLAVAFASAAGAEVHVLAMDSRRQELAAKFGASRYWTTTDPPPGTYDAVIDCTDDQAVPASALMLVEPAGRMVYIGLSRRPSHIDTRNLVLNDITAVGILGASAGLESAIEHYADGRVIPGHLAEVVVSLDHAAEAFAGRLNPEPGTKIHIDPRL
jgi:2-desacetyl-2-hydroxyethyl bacteriochlorophyllide A dehydrogenase